MSRTNGRRARPITTVGLACLLGWTASISEIQAQVGSPRPRIRIFVRSGDGGENNIRKATGTTLIVEVRDEKNRPVAGAEVLFRAPEGGPSLIFLNGANSLVLITNDRGLVMVQGHRPNTEEGDFSINVEARYLDEPAKSASIKQKNVKGGGPPVFAVLAGVGAAVGGGLAILIRKDGPPNGPATPPTTVGLGSVTVGPPP